MGKNESKLKSQEDITVSEKEQRSSSVDGPQTVNSSTDEQTLTHSTGNETENGEEIQFSSEHFSSDPELRPEVPNSRSDTNSGTIFDEKSPKLQDLTNGTDWSSAKENSSLLSLANGSPTHTVDIDLSTRESSSLSPMDSTDDTDSKALNHFNLEIHHSSDLPNMEPILCEYSNSPSTEDVQVEETIVPTVESPIQMVESPVTMVKIETGQVPGNKRQKQDINALLQQGMPMVSREFTSLNSLDYKNTANENVKMAQSFHQMTKIPESGGLHGTQGFSNSFNVVKPKTFATQSSKTVDVQTQQNSLMQQHLHAQENLPTQPTLSAHQNFPTHDSLTINLNKNLSSTQNFLTQQENPQQNVLVRPKVFKQQTTQGSVQKKHDPPLQQNGPAQFQNVFVKEHIPAQHYSPSQSDITFPQAVPQNISEKQSAQSKQQHVSIPVHQKTQDSDSDQYENVLVQEGKPSLQNYLPPQSRKHDKPTVGIRAANQNITTQRNVPNEQTQQNTTQRKVLPQQNTTQQKVLPQQNVMKQEHTSTQQNSLNYENVLTPKDVPSHQNMTAHENIPTKRNVPSHQNIPTNRNVPSHQNVPAHGNIPSKRNVPSHQNMPTPRNVPSHQNMPPHQNIPAHNNIPTKRNLPSHQNIPTNRNVSSPKNIQTHQNVPVRPGVSHQKAPGSMDDAMNQDEDTQVCSAELQAAYQELQSLCIYINELKMSNRKILRQLNEEQTKRCEKTCTESEEKVTAIEQCITCLEERMKQREGQIKQVSEIIWGLVDKVNLLTKTVQSSSSMQVSDDDEEEDGEMDEKADDTMDGDGTKLVPTGRGADGFRRQHVAQGFDNRFDPSCNEAPKSRRLRRLAARKTGSAQSDGKRLKTGESDGSKRKVEKVQKTGEVRQLLKAKRRHTGDQKSKSSDRKRHSKDKKDGRGTTTSSRLPAKKGQSDPSVQKPFGNEFRSLLSSKFVPTDTGGMLGTMAMDMSSWIDLANIQMRVDKFSTPRGTGPDIVLCLDISESMQGDPFTQMIRIANQFIDGYERIQNSTILQHNVALVTFGTSTTVVQHLTNNLRVIRESLNALTPSGASPMAAGLLMCIAAAVGNGQVFRCFKHVTHAEVIVLSDGRASDVTVENEPDPEDTMALYEGSNSIAGVTMDLKKRDIKVSYIPLGNFYPACLQTVASITGGKEIQIDQVEKAIKKHRNFVIASEIRKQRAASGIHEIDEEMKLARLGLEAVTSGEKEVTPGDIDDMMEMVKNPEISGYIPVDKQEGDDGDDSDGDENRELPDANFPPIGTRVRRGPDWSWKNQDAEGPGTIIGHQKNGWLWVMWDSGHRNQYNYGQMGRYDVIVVDEPRILQRDQLIEVGCLVMRGTDWSDGENDGGSGSVGVVYRVFSNATVGVRWPNRNKKIYKYGRDGKFEVKICDPSEVAARMLEDRLEAAASGGSSSEAVTTVSKEQISKQEQQMNERNRSNKPAKKETSSSKGDDSSSLITPRGNNSSHQIIPRGPDRSQRSVVSVNQGGAKKKEEVTQNQQTTERSQRSVVSANQRGVIKKQEVTQNQQTPNIQSPAYSRPRASVGSGDTYTNDMTGNATDQHPQTVNQIMEKTERQVTIEGDGVWQFKDDNEGWSNYSEENNQMLEKSYKKNPTGVKEIMVNNRVYRILFSKMMQVDKKTKFMKPVRRNVTS